MVNLSNYTTSTLETKLRGGLLQSLKRGIVGPKSAFAACVAVEYIRRVDSVEGKDLPFIKGITKGARVIRLHDKRLEDKLERLYIYNMAGVDKARLVTEDPRPTDILKMEGHMLNDAGIVCEALYDQTSEMIWLDKGYRHIKEASSILVEVEADTSSQLLSYAADVARRIYLKTGDLEIGQEAFELYFQVATEGLQDDKALAANHISAGMLSELIYLDTKDTVWLERWASSLLKAKEIKISAKAASPFYLSLARAMEGLGQNSHAELFEKLEERYQNIGLLAKA
jgi:hypothetical protein